MALFEVLLVSCTYIAVIYIYIYVYLQPILYISVTTSSGSADLYHEMYASLCRKADSTTNQWNEMKEREERNIKHAIEVSNLISTFKLKYIALRIPFF